MNNSKKVLRLTVGYAELFNRCPPEQLRHAKLLQEKHKQYRERLYELPEEPPKIDWEFYKQKVRPEYVSLVEEFEKKYNEMKVPYPEDPYTPQIEEMKKIVEEEICAYKAESNKRIEELETQIVIKCCQTPIEEMTLEEYCEYFPEHAPDFINRPTFWPHTPEEQTPGPANPELVSRMHKEIADMDAKYEEGYSDKEQTEKASTKETEKVKKKDEVKDKKELKLTGDKEKETSSKAGEPKSEAKEIKKSDKTIDNPKPS